MRLSATKSKAIRAKKEPVSSSNWCASRMFAPFSKRGAPHEDSRRGDRRSPGRSRRRPDEGPIPSIDASDRRTIRGLNGENAVGRAEGQARLWRAVGTACVALLGLAALCSCETPAQKQAAHNAEVNRQASKEIKRICALHGDERAAELKKIKDQSGLELYCPND